MRAKIVLFKEQNKELPDFKCEALKDKVWVRTMVSALFRDKAFNECLWYEKAMLAMIFAKGYDCNSYGLRIDSLELEVAFGAIRSMNPAGEDLGEIIYILDQFLRRLNTINLTENSLTEVALICAIVGMKMASDEAVWNSDLIDLYNEKLQGRDSNFITKERILELEREHLAHLNYFVGFGAVSKQDERIQQLMNFVDFDSLHFIEKSLQQLQHIDPSLKIGSTIQKAVFKRTSDMEMSFFARGRRHAKTDDQIMAGKTLDASSHKVGFLNKSR